MEFPELDRSGILVRDLGDLLDCPSEKLAFRVHNALPDLRCRAVEETLLATFPARRNPPRMPSRLIR
jgi:hypothetical protein